jgi:hypothetical protein
MEKKILIYKNDLKFNDNITEDSDFDTDNIKDMYNQYKKKSKIELRIKDSELENYNYLDLSNLGLDDKLLSKLFKLDKIIFILKKIEYLDLSSNKLTKTINLDCYKNIIYFNISRNEICGTFEDQNIIELNCEYNNITSVVSNSIQKLNACSNNITFISVPRVKILLINDNKLSKLDTLEHVEYMECINNNIKTVGKFNKLKEIFIANNLIEDVDEMNELAILNCVNNPIKRIKHVGKLNIILCSTPNISSKYKIKNISKINSNYLINLV